MSSVCCRLQPVAVLLLVLSGTKTPAAAEVPPLVPWPRTVKSAAGRMALTGRGRVVTRDKKLLPLARIVANEVARVTGVRLAVEQADARDGDIALTLRD